MNKKILFAFSTIAFIALISIMIITTWNKSNVYSYATKMLVETNFETKAWINAQK